jgi:hypothetical protein
MKHTLGLRWWIGLGLLAATGCEVSVGKCDRDDAGRCIFDDDDYDYDASWMAGMDATTDASAPPPDGARPDATTQDATVVADGSMDASAATDGATADATTPAVLTAQQFCDAQFAVARSWSALFDDINCNCDSSDDRDGARSFLAAALRFDDSVIAACLSNVDRLRMNGVTFDGSKAAACATRFSSQFKGPQQFVAPVSSCSGGFDIAKLEGEVGHGRQALAQLPECRAALVGTKALNAPCSDSFECGSGLRCRTIPGGGSSTCQAAVGLSGPCSKNDDCADGHLCSLNVQATESTPASFACIPVDQLKFMGGNCQTSSECVVGNVCDVATRKCIPAPTDRICAP